MILDTSYARLVLAPQVLGAGFDEIFFPEISLASVNRQNCDCSYLVDLLRCLNSLIFFFSFFEKTAAGISRWRRFSVGVVHCHTVKAQMPSNIHSHLRSVMSCCRQSRTNGDVDGSGLRVSSSLSRRQVIDQQPKPGPHLHHPTIATHVAHHGSVLSWSSADSPLPSMTPNYPAAHYDDGYSPAVELGSVGLDGKLVIAIDFGAISRFVLG